VKHIQKLLNTLLLTLPVTQEHVDCAGQPPEFKMLFDLEGDPGERINPVHHAKHAGILAELRQKCAEQSVSINQRREAFKAIVDNRHRTARPKKAKQTAEEAEGERP
jgi:hypothetical protein